MNDTEKPTASMNAREALDAGRITQKQYSWLMSISRDWDRALTEPWNRSEWADGDTEAVR